MAHLLNHPYAQCGELDPTILEFHSEGNKKAETGLWSVVDHWKLKRPKLKNAKCFARTATGNLLLRRGDVIRGGSLIAKERPWRGSNSQSAA
jgi:hypothetical protein